MALGDVIRGVFTGVQSQDIEVESLMMTGMDTDELARYKQHLDQWKCYYGDHPDTLKIRQGQPNDNTTINRGRRLVDTSASWLFGQPFKLSETEEDHTDLSPGEKFAQAFYRANREQQPWMEACTNGGVNGTAYMRIEPRGAPKDPTMPRIVPLDPRSIVTDTCADDSDIIIRHTRRWVEGKTLHRQVTEADGLIEAGTNLPTDDEGYHLPITGWTIREEVYQNNQWRPVGSPVVWDKPYCPIQSCHNLLNPGQPYGLADLEPDVMSLVYAYNAVASNVRKIIRHHAHPKTWTKLAGEGDSLDISVDGILMLQNKDAAIGNLEMKSDLASSRNFYNDLAESLSEVSRVPRVVFETVQGVGQITGVALKILYAPLMELTGDKRMTYGPWVDAINYIAADLAGVELNPLVIFWPNPMPQADLEEGQSLALDATFGASKTSLLRKRGYDPEVEKQQRLEEAKDAAAEAALVPVPPPVAPQPGQSDLPGVHDAVAATIHDAHKQESGQS